MSTPILKLKWWPQLLGPLIFFFSGLTFLAYPGLQNDEALPASAIYRINDSLYHPRILKHEIPVMFLSYLGALKTWLYAPILQLWRPSYLSIRLPALLFGSVTVWLFWLLLERIHGRTAAWIGMLLLATDSMFLMTTCFDWGPVALQHLLATAGILLTVCFYQRRSVRALAGAMFCFGLAFWDKALFAWLFGGLIAATLLVFPRELWSRLSPKHLGVAAAALCLGALPLIVFNVTNGLATFHSNSRFSFDEANLKIHTAMHTWEGAALFGYIVNEDTAERPRQPSTSVEKFSFGVRSLAGPRQYNGLLWGLLAAVLCVPFLWRSRARPLLLFCAIAILAAWLQMALTAGAGNSAHHVVLLWPLPHLFMAVVFGQMVENWGKAGLWLFSAAITLLVVLNLLVTNQYLYQFARNGGEGSWSDAIYSLSEELPKVQASLIGVIDWGIIQPLDVLNEGRLPLFWSGDPFIPVPVGQSTPEPDARLLNDPQVLWLGHTDGNEQFKGVNQGVTEFAKAAGYREIPVQMYFDRNGRAIFRTFRLRKQGLDEH